MRPDGGPAFPGTKRISGPSFVPGKASVEVDVSSIGMSLRDYFAAAALQGMFANPSWDAQQVSDPKRAAFSAYNYADAMLAEREKK